MTTPQTNQFVPLVTNALSADKREFQITVIPQTAQSQPFQTFEKAASASGEQMMFKKLCEPRLSVQRDGGRITHIRLQCTCGQTIDLACLYDESKKSSEK